MSQDTGAADRPSAVPGPPSAPQPRGALARLGAWSFRRRGVVLLLWVFALGATLALAGRLGGEFSADYLTPGSESKAAAELVSERFPSRSTDTVDVVWSARDVGDPAVRERIDGLLTDFARVEAVGAATPLDGGAAPAEVSPDRTVAIVRVPLEVEDAAEVPLESAERLLALAGRASGDGLRVELGGQVIANAQTGEISSETIGFLIAAVILAFTFGSIVAAGLPIVTALFGLGIGSGMIALLTSVYDVPDWSTSVAAMIGIGVGIDYALLILTRYRAALAEGREPVHAVAEAVGTAGRSVLVAGTTVVIAMLGLFAMGLQYLNGVALSTSGSVLVTMAAAVTLLPALLGFAGRGVNRLRLPGAARPGRTGEGTPSHRWSRAVQRHPRRAVLLGTAALVALTLPVTGFRLGFPDAGNDPAGTTTRAAYDLVSKGFGAGSNGPLLLVAELPERSAASRLEALGARVAEQPGVAAVTPAAANPAGDTAVMTVIPTTSPQSEETEELIARLREDVIPPALRGSGIGLDVGGTTAAAVDQGGYTLGRLPLFIGGVVGLSFLLLLAVFRSPLIAAKAGLLNLGSIGAAYGVVSLVAEGGWVGQLVGVDTPTPVPAFIPVMMFAILFGLSMDYEVFLLSRIREEYLRDGDTARAVADGLAKTARVITAAALIMVAVFGAFAVSDQLFLKLVGIGLATAILLDATVVRMVLVPAVMQLFGEANWWLPRWLDRLLPETRLEGEPPPAPRPGIAGPAVDGARA